jgi:hypothetical protein
MQHFDAVILGLQKGDLALSLPGGFTGTTAVVKPVTLKGEGVLGFGVDSATYPRSTFASFN